MIRVLPEDVANKIAAGEVIERPASVVKELVENSLDAEARRVRVDLEDGGKKLIRVSDDGLGIGAADLALAFAPHATSKIRDAGDLFQVISFGFRGEALASIGSVARASIVSRPRGEALGHRVTCERSEISDVIEAGGPEGTIVEVRNLFHATPARRKFLKSNGAEVSQVSEALTRLALAHPQLHLTFFHDGRRVLTCEPVPDFERRILSLFGRELKGRLLPVEAHRPGVEVGGFIGTPEVARGSARRQYLFLNDRFVRDKSLGHAVTRGFEGFLLPRRYPVFFLALTVDPATVDVNVHPSKFEVRFRERDLVFGAVHAACREALASARPSGRLVMSGVSTAPPADERPQTVRERVEEMEAGLFRGLPRGPTPPAPPTPSVSVPEPGSGSVPRSRAARGCRPAPRPRMPAERTRHRFIQLHDCYIVVEDADGFYVVDQHAMHERMLYEELLEQTRRGRVLGQRLLVPHVVEVSPAEHARVMGEAETLARLGLVVADFGGNAVAVEEVPLNLARCSPDRLVEAVLGAGEEDVADGFRGLEKQILAGMACRAAVKFNDRLGDDEIRALLDWERSTEDSAACPHGRPTRVRIGLDELERLFLRKD